MSSKSMFVEQRQNLPPMGGFDSSRVRNENSCSFALSHPILGRANRLCREEVEVPARVPYESQVSQEEHSHVKNRLDEWILGNDIASKEDLAFFGKRRLTKGEWELLENKRDYWPLVVARALSEPKYHNSVREHMHYSGDSDFRHDAEMQLAWFGVAIKLFEDSNRRLPDFGEYSSIVNGLSPVYRAFCVLKRDALKEDVNYPWAGDVIGHVRRAENYNIVNFIPG